MVQTNLILFVRYVIVKDVVKKIQNVNVMIVIKEKLYINMKNYAPLVIRLKHFQGGIKSVIVVIIVIKICFVIVGLESGVSVLNAKVASLSSNLIFIVIKYE
jgi:hypothetical protein